MYNNTMEFIFKANTIEAGIVFYRVNTYEDIAINLVPIVVIEGNNVCVVIVLEIFFVDS